MSFFRPLVMLAIVAGSCFLAYNFSEHHKVPMEVGEDGVEAPVKTSDIFTTLYYHVVPAPVIASHGHGDHGHHAEPPLVAIPLPLPAIFDGDESKEGTQLVLYNLQIFQLAALLMILVAMSGVPSYLRTGKGDVVTRLMGGFCQWVRDDLVEPAMGKELSAKLLPLMMYVFFFILFMNVMGLTPMSVTPTTCIFVTGALALITFVLMIAGGIIAQGPVNFLKHLVPDVPLFLWPMLFVIELLGLLIKPVALMIRLFATMTGGHLVVLSFLGLIFFFGYAFNPTLGKTLSPLWVGFAVFIMIIEAFVAMIQAYIFTLLSSLFISASVHPEH